MSGSYDRPDRPPQLRGLDPNRVPEYDPYEDLVTQGGRVTTQAHTDYSNVTYEPDPISAGEGALRSEYERQQARPDAYASARGDTRKAESMTAPIVPAGSVTGRSLTLVITIMCFLACLTVGAVYMIRQSANAVIEQLDRAAVRPVKVFQGQQDGPLGSQVSEPVCERLKDAGLLPNGRRNGAIAPARAIGQQAAQCRAVACDRVKRAIAKSGCDRLSDGAVRTKQTRLGKTGQHLTAHGLVRPSRVSALPSTRARRSSIAAKVVIGPCAGLRLRVADL